MEASPPFGMSPVLPAFHRATRIATALFGEVDATIVLIDGERVWRSGGLRAGSGLPAAGSLKVIEGGKAIWVADRGADIAKQSQNHQRNGRPRFYAGAPIRLPGGEVVGALRVTGEAPRPYDKAMAARLQDLADGVADECERARTVDAIDRAERALVTARKITTAFVTTVPVMAVMTNRHLQVLQATPLWLDRFGYTWEEVQGQVLYDLSSHFSQFRGVYELALAGQTIRNDRVRVMHEGQSVWIDSILTPWRDETGEIAGMLSAAHDITGMVKAVQTAERAQERLQLATEMARIHVYDIDYGRRSIQTAGAEMFSRDPEVEAAMRDDVFNNAGRDMVDPRDRERVEEAVRAFSEDDAPYSLEYRMLRGAGESFWVAEAMRAIKNDRGQTRRVVGALQDITDRKTAEFALVQAKDDAEAANRAKSAFLATMSHEIRTPLNGVLGMAQAMAADTLAPAQRERLDVVRQSGETLLAVLNDVLDLSKIEAGKLELEEAGFDIGQLARGAHAAFSAVAAEKGVAFDLTIAKSAAGAWRGDATRVGQILANLISNALKFTPAGTVNVAVGRRPRSGRSPGALTLTVADTGIGMSRAQQATIFRKFEQADASTTRKFGGTGLGLAICRELVEAMGGTIAVTSAEGRGSTFTAALPLQRAARRAPRARAKSALAPTTTAAQPAAPDLAAVDVAGAAALRVLAAEDNPVNQLVLKTLLNQIGVEPVMVADGVDAVAAWEQQAWDVILMDVQMPRMDGPTATRFIREREAAQARPRTPIVALTANAMTHQVAEYLAAGMDAVVAKPIEVRALFGAIEGVLAAGEDEGRLSPREMPERRAHPGEAGAALSTAALDVRLESAIPRKPDRSTHNGAQTRRGRPP